MTSPAARYTGVAIALHWLIAILALGQVAGGLYMHNLPDGAAEKVALYQLHKSFGVTVLVLTLFRLFWRFTHPAPVLPAAMSGLEKAIARSVHVLFYAVLIGIPLIGWALVSASPYAETVQTYLFGVIHMPHLPFFDEVENRKEVARSIAEVHEYLAFAMVGLVGLHVVAALKHQFINRDGVLGRMLPFFK
jgi:cytochrome b561